MATKKSTSSFKPMPAGTPVSFRYRSAHPTGTIAGVAKKGSTAKSTIYSIRPSAKDRHPGEPATVHRHGDKGGEALQHFWRQHRKRHQAAIVTKWISLAGHADHVVAVHRMLRETPAFRRGRKGAQPAGCTVCKYSALHGSVIQCEPWTSNAPTDSGSIRRPSRS